MEDLLNAVKSRVSRVRTSSSVSEQEGAVVDVSTPAKKSNAMTFSKSIEQDARYCVLCY